MTTSNAVLSNFELVLPPHEGPQDQLVAWTAACHHEAEFSLNADPAAATSAAKWVLRYAVKPDKIAHRRFECADFHTTTDWDSKKIYNVTPAHPQGATIFERTHFFAEKALTVFRDFYGERARSRPDHIVHVTCTGYISPSAPQRMVAEPAWGKHTSITHAYHMGCYAALPAVRMAAAYTSQGVQQVDVVHTEMCGLHMNPTSHTPEQIVVQSLFADGHVKYSVGRDGPGLRILGIQEWLVPDSEDDMSWIPSPWGMQMTLSREVPEKIAGSLRPFLQTLCQDSDEDLAAILKNAIFAVHPGGPKIIDGVQALFELSDSQVSFSNQILRERGNMSSATLPHIWKAILDSKPKVGTKVASFAFGPGLTLFGALFEVV